MRNTCQKTCFILLPLLLSVIVSLAGAHKSGNDSLIIGKPIPVITDSMLNESYLLLSSQYGKNKTIPEGYEKQVLFTLSYFPELANTAIIFRFEKTKKGIISSRPRIGSLLKKSSRRTYIVTMEDSTEGRRMPIWANCDINGQIGILGHELSHIIYFSKHTGLGLLGLGIAHISKKYMDNFENKTDSVDIERGLSYQLISWNQYLRKSFAAINPSFLQKMHPPGSRERYMSIEHIRRLVAKSKIYD